ncbi:MAG: HNH endonuclease signature motif containing protein [Planctomycetota bacterium]
MSNAVAVHEPVQGVSGPCSPSPAERLARARRLEAKCIRLAKLGRRVEAKQAVTLRKVDRTRAWEALGYGSLRAFAEKHFEWCGSKVGKMFKLLDRLEEPPLLKEAFFAGQVDYSKAVLVGRILEEEPEREGHWLDEARSKSYRQLQHEIAQARGIELLINLVLRLTGEQRAVVEAGCRALISEGFEFEDTAAAVVELIRRALEGGKAGSSAYRVILSQEPITGQITQETRAGTVVVPPEVVERVLEGAEVQEPSGKISRHIPQVAQRAVVARAHGRCEVPGCPEMAGLEFHHSIGWKNGHEVNRLFHLCHGHHRACHAGALYIRGSWDKGVVFCLADNTVIGAVVVEAERRAAQVSAAEAERRPAQVSAAEPQPERRAAQATGASRLYTRRENERDAVAALRKLEFTPRRAKELVSVALARDPGLAESAERLVAEALRAS